MPAKKKADDAPKASEPKKAEPHEINSSLSSDRMKALLADHRKMGARPK